MYYTSLEQSKKLLDLGLDAKTHDMFYRQEIGRKTDMPYYDVQVGNSVAVEQNLFSFRNGYEIPCWSVEALTNVLPSQDWKNHLYQIMIDNEKPIIEELYRMVVWLLENGYILKTQI